MSRIVTKVLVEEFFSDGSNTVLSVVLETHSGIVSVDVGEHVHELSEVAEVADFRFWRWFGFVPLGTSGDQKLAQRRDCLGHHEDSLMVVMMLWLDASAIAYHRQFDQRDNEGSP